MASGLIVNVAQVICMKHKTNVQSGWQLLLGCQVVMQTPHQHTSLRPLRREFGFCPKIESYSDSLDDGCAAEDCKSKKANRNFAPDLKFLSIPNRLTELEQNQRGQPI